MDVPGYLLVLVLKEGPVIDWRVDGMDISQTLTCPMDDSPNQTAKTGSSCRMIVILLGYGEAPVTIVQPVKEGM